MVTNFTFYLLLLQRDLGSIPGRVIPKTQKWYLMPPCLTLSIIRYRSRVKWSNPGKGIAPSPTPWCSSYRKGSLQVTLDYGRQLYFTVANFQNNGKIWISCVDKALLSDVEKILFKQSNSLISVIQTLLHWK